MKMAGAAVLVGATAVLLLRHRGQKKIERQQPRHG